MSGLQTLRRMKRIYRSNVQDFRAPRHGKTTTLLNLVDKHLEEGVLPNQICFLAFTRKAAREAKERAAAAL